MDFNCELCGKVCRVTDPTCAYCGATVRDIMPGGMWGRVEVVKNLIGQFMAIEDLEESLLQLQGSW